MTPSNDPWHVAGADGCFFVLSHAVQSLVLEQEPRPGLADVTLYAYPPEYGLKVIQPPPVPEALFMPTTYGPNYEGEIDGALLLPAVVAGVRDEDGGVRNVPVAGAKFTLTAQDISTSVAIGILPFKGSG